MQYKNMTPEQKKKKAGKISYLHQKMRKIIPKPPECQICNEIKDKLHLASIFHTYTTDPNEWIYVCYKGKNNCHAILDGKTLTNNKEEYNKQYRQSEHRKEKIKLWKLKNPKYQKEYQKQYRQSEHGKAIRKENNRLWRLKNLEHYKEYHKEYYRKHKKTQKIL